ncbi:MAG: redoxin domain-containing protein [Bacteroides sp.]|nr:redoxin domain-containing protein [Bacteroides sp.]
MKKNHLAYLFALLLLAACGEKQPEGTLLTGNIKGLGNDTIYLFGTDGIYDRMDTIAVAQDKFSILLPVDTLVAANLLFADGTLHPIYLNKGEKITVNGSTAESDFLEISGNTHNADLTTYRRELKEMPAPTDKALTEKAEAFIKSHPASMLSIHLILQHFVLKEHPDLRQAKRLIDLLTGELKDRPEMTHILELAQEEDKIGTGRSVPYFQLTNTKGEKMSRTDFKEQYLLLHFWASWDSLSYRHNSHYRPIYNKVKKNKHFALVGISLDADKEQWLSAVERDTLQWEQLRDSTGWNADMLNQLCIRRLPANILLNPGGRIEARDLSPAELEKKIAEITAREEVKEKARQKKKR